MRVQPISYVMVVSGEQRRDSVIHTQLDQYREFVKLFHQIMSRMGEILTTSLVVEALGEMGFMLLAVRGEENCWCLGAGHGVGLARLPLQHPLLSNRSLGEGLWSWDCLGSDACCSKACIFPPCCSIFQGEWLSLTGWLWQMLWEFWVWDNELSYVISLKHNNTNILIKHFLQLLSESNKSSGKRQWIPLFLDCFLPLEICCLLTLSVSLSAPFPGLSDFPQHVWECK